MADIKYYDVILKPVITEKSMTQMADKKYTFLVHVDANKSQIKEAVEKMFEGTKVAKVNTMNCLGKNKRRGMVYGKTAQKKKAIVQLTEESADIQIFEELDSTNNEAKRMLASGFTGNALIVAETQTTGRGRKGKTFF